MNQQQQTIEALPKVPLLYYPPIRGTAQPVRNLLYYLEMNFQQVTVIQNTKQLQAGFNSGYPKFIHQQFDITDAAAIFRHLCRYSGRMDLLGLTPQNRAVINQFLFNYSDVRIRMTKKITQGAKSAWGKQVQGEIYQIKVNTLKVIVQDECKILKDYLQMYMKNKDWLLQYLTILDFFFYEICYYLVNFLGSVMKNNLIYRNFELFYEHFENQQWFQKYKQNLQNKKIFMPFKEKMNQQIIRSFWQGNKDFLC